MAGYPSEQPLSIPLDVVHQIARRQQQDSTYFTPAQAQIAAILFRNNDPLGFLGDKIQSEFGLRDMARQIVQSADPRTRAGLINDLSMFVGGPKGDASGPLNEAMPGQFEAYSIPKAQMGEQVGRMVEGTHILPRSAFHKPEDVFNRARVAHDQMFGGEVHAKGPIPPKPTHVEPPASTHEVIQRVAANKAQSSFDAEAARARAEQQLLARHGFQNLPNRHSQELLNQRVRASFHGDRNVDSTGTMAYNHTRVAQRQAVLERLYQMMQHNHRN